MGDDIMCIQYEIVPPENCSMIGDLCNDLMAYQKSKASIHPEFFDNMRFETRMIPSIRGAKANYIVAARDGDEIIGYAYSTISSKYTYSGGFATLHCDEFFDFNSVKGEDVGSLSQFYLKNSYRGKGIGSALFNMSMDWISSFESISDIFIFVSNGNEDALRFYLNKGFKVSHEILDGFITVLRNAG
jgi:GNAT superfamily N-acetyltransferase